MDSASFAGLWSGLLVAAQPLNLLLCFVGVVLGTLVGVLPGVGPVVTISLLLPLTFGLDPVAALIMLAGIYYGAQYGGSTTAILLKLPGETSAMLTCLDGHEMAKQGRAASALGISAIGSFVAGIVGTLVVVGLAPLLVSVALEFGPADYFSLMLVGLVASVVVAQGGMLKAVAMIFVGLLLGIVGTDVYTGIARFSFGQSGLRDGINFVVVAMGLFGFGEIIANLEQGTANGKLVGKVRNAFPTRQDLLDSWKPILRGTGIGAALGVLPGAGAAVGAFAAYTVEKKIAKFPGRFGKGAIEGVAAPEAANNAAAQTNFIPLLTLGLPSGAVMALMAGAMMIHGVAPGPEVMTTRPELFWGLIASMLIGNIMLLFLNLNLIRVWVRVLQVPYALLFPLILLLCSIGIYSLNNSVFDVGLAAVFGLVGYFFIKTGCEPAPLLMGFILGPMLEENLRRALVLSRGDPTVFVTHPISAAFLAIAVLIVVTLALRPAGNLLRRATGAHPIPSTSQDNGALP
jgi:putative tricarboxylic transport membrane protein